MENLDKGYIKLYRSVRDNWIWDAGPYDRAHAWIDILLSASHCDTKMMFDGNLVTVKRGTYITSIRKLAVKWGWSRDKVINPDGSV